MEFPLHLVAGPRIRIRINSAVLLPNVTLLTVSDLTHCGVIRIIPNKLIEITGLNFIQVEDFNMLPDVIRDSQWLSSLKATIKTLDIPSALLSF